MNVRSVWRFAAVFIVFLAPKPGFCALAAAIPGAQPVISASPAPEASSAPAPASSAVPMVPAISAPMNADAPSRRYLIGPRDELSIQVLGVDALSRDLTVLPDGTISYPLLGSITAAGRTVENLRQDITFKLKHYVRNPYVSITMVHTAQLTVLVMGNVKQPGRYQLDRGAHVSDAVAAAGGLGPTDGMFPDARIGKASGQVSEVSMESLMRHGDSSADAQLDDRDSVYIEGPQSFSVTVAGSVDHPGQVTMREGDRLSAAIALAGVGASTKADLSRVSLTHAGETRGAQAGTRVNVLRAMQQGGNAASDDPVLLRGDMVYVPKEHVGGPLSTPEAYYFLAGLKLLLFGF